MNLKIRYPMAYRFMLDSGCFERSQVMRSADMNCALAVYGIDDRVPYNGAIVPSFLLFERYADARMTIP